jgi:hypothetical protein
MHFNIPDSLKITNNYEMPTIFTNVSDELKYKTNAIAKPNNPKEKHKTLKLYYLEQDRTLCNH